MRRPPSSLRNGFTLLELLVAAALAMIVIGALLLIVTRTSSLKGRQSQMVNQQQMLRASVEVISQDLRLAVGPRVNFTGLTPLNLPISDNNGITIFVPVPNSTFVVAQPGSGTLISTATSTILSSMTSQESTACSDIFSTTPYGLFLSTIGTNVASGNSFIRPRDASQVFKVTSPPCGTNAINHSTLNTRTWNPNTFMIGVQPINYRIQDGNLVRQIYGVDTDPQVVAYNVNSLNITYQAAGNPTPSSSCNSAVFLTAISCEPANINITLGSGSSSPLTYSQIVNLRY